MAADYSGVATSDLARIYREYKGDEPIDSFAERLGHCSRKLRMVLDEQRYQFTGLKLAANILEEGLGLNISALVHAGDLVMIPAARESAAVKMVEDRIWVEAVSAHPEAVSDEEIEAVAAEARAKYSDEEIEAMAQELRDLRASRCGPLTERQIRAREEAKPKRPA